MKKKQDIVYEEWNDTIIPALEQIDTPSIIEQPILHADILAKAPPHIIRDIISRFNCITTQDSMNRYPIDVAVAEGLQWDEGMEEIVHRFIASTEEQQVQTRLMINIATLHGLQL